MKLRRAFREKGSTGLCEGDSGGIRPIVRALALRPRPRSARHPGRSAAHDDHVRLEAARGALLAAFSSTYSYSLQQTLYAMGEAVLTAVPEACEVRLALPNKHHFLVDLSPFGLPNENEVYYAADRPYGLIEGTVTRDDAPDPGRAWQSVPGF